MFADTTCGSPIDKNWQKSAEKMVRNAKKHLPHTDTFGKVYLCANAWDADVAPLTKLYAVGLDTTIFWTSASVGALCGPNELERLGVAS